MTTTKKGPAKAAAAKPQKMSAREAARVVLTKHGKPMHYREITKQAIEQGIVRVPGSNRKRPDFDKTMRTIRSFLCEREGVEFVRVDSGVFDLKARTEEAAKAARSRARSKKGANA